MKKFLFIIVIGMLIFSSCVKKEGPVKTPPAGDGQPKEQVDKPGTEQPDLKVSDYFPFVKDTHMKYKGTGNEFAEMDTYVDYIKGNLIQLREINPGTTMVRVYEVGNGELKRVYNRGESYYRMDFTSLRKDEEVLIKEPIKTGTEWTLKNGVKRSITGIDKDVSTPLGSYKALEVTTVYPDSKTQDYYAKGVGLVKRVFTPSADPENKIVTELEKIEKDVPFKFRMAVYFPDFEKERIVFVWRNIEILTDQDMKYKFQKELKTIPEGSKLTKTLTPGVQVLSASVDEAKSTATIDFSSHLVTEMNAGSGLESLILKSLVNTFGSYYQVNKVIITLEGKPYSSGHILMKPGEAFTVNTQNAVEW